jgi:hypothetical protein
LLLPSAAWHPQPTTLIEAQLDHESGALEVALHVTPADLETTLTRSLGRSIRLDREPDLESLLRAHVQEHFQVLDAQGVAAPLSWIGMESELRDVWLYFELDLEGDLHEKILFVDLLANVQDDYLSTVTLRAEDASPRSLRFDRKTQSLPLKTE